jgi:hypothetical protein
VDGLNGSSCRVFAGCQAIMDGQTLLQERSIQSTTSGLLAYFGGIPFYHMSVISYSLHIGIRRHF